VEEAIGKLSQRSVAKGLSLGGVFSTPCDKNITLSSFDILDRPYSLPL